MTEAIEGWDPSRATRQMRCERCGTTFGCRNLGEAGSCWCSLEKFRLPVPLPDGVGPFDDCLCPACLRAVAADLEATCATSSSSASCAERATSSRR
jgi:hypothetical protein